LTNAEIDVLTRSAHSIAENIPSGSMIIELGSGLVIAKQLSRCLATNPKTETCER
jgi:hypothetical protein